MQQQIEAIIDVFSPEGHRSEIVYCPEKPVGEWNDMDFLCKGGEIKVWLNGVLVNTAKCDATEGYIGIQSEGGPMDFRNIYLDFPK